MRRLRISIRIKVLLLLGSLLLVIFGILALVFVRNDVHSLRQNLTDQSASFAELATQPIGKTFLVYKDSGTVRIDQQVEQFSRLNDTITNVVIYDLDAKVVYAQHDKTVPRITPQQASTFDREYIYGAQGELVSVIQPFIEDSGVHQYGILYTVSNARIDRSIRQGVLTIIGFALFALLLVGTVLFIAMNELLLKPIGRLSRAALVISAGQLDKQIPEERHDEIGDLAQSVNTMADSLKADIAKLQEADKLKSEFMIIASHNLRTPLTIIKGYLDLLKTMTLPGQAHDMVEQIDTSSNRLGQLAEEILTTAQIEAGQRLDDSVENVDLAKLVNTVVRQHQPDISKQGLVLDMDKILPGITVRASGRYLEQVVWNILDNAIKFTKKGGSINISLSQADGRAVLAIADTGIGISPEEQGKLFTKFHRGTSVMEYNYEGTGLGLYISRLIVNQFGGDISVESALGKGSTFTIRLPVTAASPAVS